jgi:predicted DNA binding CopG/RHH family protein
MHSQEKKTVNATVRLDEEDWEAIKSKARALGMKSRTEFLKAIARGYIEARKTLSTEEKQVLGKF